jgi:hypothetical protein
VPGGRYNSPLREIFSELPYVLIVTSGPDHRIEFCNPATLDIFQVGRDILGKPLADVYPRFAEEGHLRTFTHVYETGEIVSRREVPLTSPQWAEAIKYFDIIVRPLRDQDGHIDGVVGHAVEVTSLVLARQRLEQAVRARDDFASACIPRTPQSVEYALDSHRNHEAQIKLHHRTGAVGSDSRTGGKDA